MSYGPVARLKHRVSKAARPASWPEPPLAGEDSNTSRRKHEVVTPPSNLWSDDEDGQPCWTGPEQFYCAGLPMGSQLSPGRMQHCYVHVRTPHHHIPHPTPPPLQLHATPAFSQTTPLLPNCMQPRHYAKTMHVASSDLLQNETLSRPKHNCMPQLSERTARRDHTLPCPRPSAHDQTSDRTSVLPA